MLIICTDEGLDAMISGMLGCKESSLRVTLPRVLDCAVMYLRSRVDLYHLHTPSCLTMQHAV